MKLDEIRALSTEELNAKVYELKQELLALRFQQATGQLENGKKMTEIRKTIARIYTVIKERELGLAK
jgi:large subunit ribosomal protein L29